MIWKDILNYNGDYQVSDTGLVKSVSRKGHDGRELGEKLLRPYKMPNGYMTVCLRKDGKTKRHYVHRLVCDAFVDNPKHLPVVNHVDGDKSNNNVDNLEWVSYSCNNQHAYDTGLKQCGSGFYSAKLTESDVINILKCGKYTTYENIAEMYGVSRATIRDVLERRTWKHIHISESSNDYP